MKSFTRKTSNTTPNRHQDKNGWQCPGRAGYCVYENTHVTVHAFLFKLYVK